MKKATRDAAMLWGMAANITLSLILLRQLQAVGLHPLHATLFQALGCAACIALVDRGAVGRLVAYRSSIRYFVIASLLGFTIPRLVVSGAVSHTGVGLTTLAFTLPLVVTYVIALVMNVESFDRKRLAFLSLTLIGALLYISTRGATVHAESHWLYILMLAPIALGIGNIYRSVAWPGDLSPTTTALATALCSLVTYGALAAVYPAATPWTFFTNGSHLVLLLLFMGIAGSSQLLLFHLQQSAGPVYIGQSGALVVLLGGVTGSIFFNEHYSLITLLGSVLIAAGVYTYCRSRALEGSP